jgi:hypothetical protein
MKKWLLVVFTVSLFTLAASHVTTQSGVDSALVTSSSEPIGTGGSGGGSGTG